MDYFYHYLNLRVYLLPITAEPVKNICQTTFPEATAFEENEID